MDVNLSFEVHPPDPALNALYSRRDCGVGPAGAVAENLTIP
jgi:hypothetical protein